MALDPLIVRWESLGVVAGAMAVAAWSLSTTSARVPATERAGEASKIVLQVRRAGAPVETIEAEDGCLIGRGRECAIVFDDATVSKWHARLNVEDKNARLEDLNSTNGTLLNGRRVEGMVRVKRGDRIGIGANRIVIAGIIGSRRARS